MSPKSALDFYPHRFPPPVVSLTEYRIFETEQFQRDLEALSRSGQTRVVAKVQGTVYPQLRSHPHFGPNIRKLRGYEPEIWRYRIGAWRSVHEIDEEENVVFMLTASHRSSAY